MKRILFLMILALPVISGCGTDTVYQANCPLSTQPQVVQNFFSHPTQCWVQGNQLFCTRVQ